MLFVCGSLARALRLQAARLVASERCRGVIMPVHGRAGEGRGDERQRAAADAWEGGDLLVQTPAERLDAGTAAPSTLVVRVAEFAVALVARKRPGGLFVSGGDTATAVLAAAGVQAVRLRGEALPGAAWGLAVGGRLDGVVVVTRSGAFGGEEDLVEIHRRCRNGAERG
jgi:uncharacterized protein YgbK (DUF1537 family)